jgi:hypothetical protein
MDGQPTEYLKRVDEIMTILVNEFDKRSRHPDEIVRGLMNASPHLFIVGSKPTDLPREEETGGRGKSRKLNKSEPLP